jgi:hypothetical protein
MRLLAETTVAGHRPRAADYTHSTPPDRAGATCTHIGKNPLKLGRRRPPNAIDGPIVGQFSIGTLSLHVAQYAPCKRVSRKPRMPRRSLITVSSIVGPPHRSHSIAIFRLRLSFSTDDIKQHLEQIKNNNATGRLWPDQREVAQTEAEDLIQPRAMADEPGRKAVSKVTSELGHHSANLSLPSACPPLVQAPVSVNVAIAQRTGRERPRV